jgi:OOP family OmpA-OmpF porin
MHSLRNTARSSISRTLASLGITAALALPTAALAEGPYVFVGAGKTKTDVQHSAVYPGFTGSIDDSDTGWKLGAGYRFHRNVAVELSYADLGEAKGSGTVGAQSLTGTVEASAIAISAVGILPINDAVSLTGRLGMASWDSEAKGTLGSTAVSDKDSGTDPVFGIGARYSFSKNVAARVEWDRYADIDDEGPSDVDLLSVGVVFQF